MDFYAWNGYCLCPLGGTLPSGCEKSELFAPFVFLVNRPPEKSRGLFAVSSVDEVFEAEDARLLLPPVQTEELPPLREFVEKNGASVLNTSFARAFDFLLAPKKTKGFRLNLVGLGDVGGTLLTALKLLGGEMIDSIGIFDPVDAQVLRYEQELNQVLGTPFPRIVPCPQEALFDCDALLFTASRGVPAVGSGVADVRMAQYEKNREMLKIYAKQARISDFNGLFCQISDPVDQLSRVVFLESNRDESGVFDAKGLLPEQVQGFGLGVMAARAAYFAEKEGISFENGRLYGPHGADLVVANHPTAFDEALSAHLTQKTVTANQAVRALGFKPYLAPALSSAALSILSLLRGQTHYGAVPIGGAYFGCRSRFTPLGLFLEREPLASVLVEKLEAVRRSLEVFPYD